MALTATIYQFDIDLADSDRGVYDTLALRLARHPSESEEYLLTRLIAYALEVTEGIGFSRGLAEPDEPAVLIRDLTGRLTAWIDVGTPDAARLHKASKAAPRVAVYIGKDPKQWMGRLSGERIHRVEALEVWAISPPFLATVAARLDRRMAFSLTVADRELYLSIGAETVTGSVTRHSLA